MTNVLFIFSFGLDSVPRLHLHPSFLSLLTWQLLHVPCSVWILIYAHQPNASSLALPTHLMSFPVPRGHGNGNSLSMWSLGSAEPTVCSPCVAEKLSNCIPNSPYQLHHPLLFLRELTGLAIPPRAFTGLTWAFFPKHNKHYKRRRRKLFCSHLEDELTVMRLELCLFLGRDEFMAWSPGRKPGLVEFWLCYFLEMSLWEVATQLLRFLNMKVKVSHWCLNSFRPHGLYRVT